jgi:4-hydroxy-3-methylbut-2-enyl diphosphate reductase
VLVIGSRNSSNSNRLVETGACGGGRGAPDRGRDGIDERWFAGAETAGLTAGASAPEHLVRRVCDWFRAVRS